jgi:hypothetical protein
MEFRKYYGTTKIFLKLLAEFLRFSGVRYGVGQKSDKDGIRHGIIGDGFFAVPPRSAIRGRRLRVGPKSSRGLTKPSKHQPDGRQAEERHRGPVEILEILRQPPAPSEPTETAFDDPSFR